ncbi:ornithine cyclodeaminase family protein [Afifella sp. H1R]|uniref:ornithine cyclodeaminase family protein n=1 Tax=unclassified Afifella TaxID=2624128 RepID=UPI001F22D811|nr:ornithine cyclodeaminase family protein [Afifella sp. H1R]MCF1505250.1 ornithine cyclodeaminase family protein [Afifella sp. H1R]
MRLVTETQARTCVTLENAIEAVATAFRDVAEGSARNLPVVRERLASGLGTFGVKSGEIDRFALVGLKAGGYWPGNAAKSDLTNHQSTTLLFDATSGKALACVEANWLTEARTAAAGAVAIRALSRPDSTDLGILGTGMQARSQVEAAMAVRDIETVRIWGPEHGQAKALAEMLSEAHPQRQFILAEREDTVRCSDILITVTPSQAELFPEDWSPAGQHINAMGADTAGKQELPVPLLARSCLFYDDLVQSATLGEFQRIDLKSGTASSLLDVLAGKAEGRKRQDERTIFDSTGIAVQDLAVAQLALSGTV